jgi:hypothetical protein
LVPDGGSQPARRDPNAVGDELRQRKRLQTAVVVGWIRLRQDEGFADVSRRVEKSSVLRIAWRDYQSVNPAATGAFIQIKDCRLRFGDTRSLVLPEQQWVRVTMRGELGRERGVWNLEVAIPGQPVQTVPAIPYAHPAFRSLTWFGVMSEAHVASTCFLDGVDLDVR